VNVNVNVKRNDVSVDVNFSRNSICRNTVCWIRVWLPSFSPQKLITRTFNRGFQQEGVYGDGVQVCNAVLRADSLAGSSSRALGQGVLLPELSLFFAF